MRYEDWDLLVFPGGPDGGRVPTQEFKTQCYSVHDETAHPNGPQVVPLMTTFIPSLPFGAPFQVSVHSWNPSPFLFNLNAGSDDSIQNHVWHVQVVVDGVVQAIEVFKQDPQWPKVIAHSNTHLVDGDAPLLQFPPFHRSIMESITWNALDDTGRIKVEVSEGWLSPDGKTFHKLATHAIFNFQPVPLETLQRVEIAWPNPTMLARPNVHHPARPVVHIPFIPAASRQPSFTSLYSRDLHQRNPSMQSNFSVASAAHFSSSPAFGGNMPGPPPPTPNFVSDRLGANGTFDGSSRSTSAYTDMPQTAMPLAVAPAYPVGGPCPNVPPCSSDHDQIQRRSQIVKLSIATDQLSRVARAFAKDSAASVHLPPMDSHSMPPPPLPHHAVQARDNGTSGPHRLQSPVMADSGAQVSEEDLISVDRRAAARSNVSDISMHPDCEHFPSCTSEDAHGQLIHHSMGVAPAAIMRGRKEGSADLTNRDFFSHVLNQQSDGSAGSPSSGASVDKVSTLPSSSPAVGSTKKRTRSALKQLNVTEAGSPDKEAAKPARKLRQRKLVVAGSDD